MANVLLGVTGSVAAIKTPELFAQMRQQGHAVKVVATSAALYFFNPAALAERDGRRDPDVVILDEDEWPGRAVGQGYQRGDPVLHIELRRWADLLLIAPLDANTLGKLALGLSDNCLTCIYRAWDPARPIVLAPAMNTLMWQHPATGRHLRQIALDCGVSSSPDGLALDHHIETINAQGSRLRIVPPRETRLACNDVGIGAMALVDEIATLVMGLVAAQE